MELPNELVEPKLDALLNVLVEVPKADVVVDAPNPLPADVVAPKTFVRNVLLAVVLAPNEKAGVVVPAPNADVVGVFPKAVDVVVVAKMEPEFGAPNAGACVAAGFPKIFEEFGAPKLWDVGTAALPNIDDAVVVGPPKAFAVPKVAVVVGAPNVDVLFCPKAGVGLPNSEVEELPKVDDAVVVAPKPGKVLPKFPLVVDGTPNPEVGAKVPNPAMVVEVPNPVLGTEVPKPAVGAPNPAAVVDDPNIPGVTEDPKLADVVEAANPVFWAEVPNAKGVDVVEGTELPPLLEAADVPNPLVPNELFGVVPKVGFVVVPKLLETFVPPKPVVVDPKADIVGNLKVLDIVPKLLDTVVVAEVGCVKLNDAVVDGTDALAVVAFVEPNEKTGFGEVTAVPNSNVELAHVTFLLVVTPVLLPTLKPNPDDDFGVESVVNGLKLKVGPAELLVIGAPEEDAVVVVPKVKPVETLGVVVALETALLVVLLPKEKPEVVPTDALPNKLELSVVLLARGNENVEGLLAADVASGVGLVRSNLKPPIFGGVVGAAIVLGEPKLN